MVYSCKYKSPIGDILIASDEIGLTGLWFVWHNEISIIIPCHRVVGTSGSLTGYAGGIDKKIALLELEHTDMSHFFVPKKGTTLCSFPQDDGQNQV